LPKSDVVSCFHPGSSQKGEPDFTATRGQLWLWRDAGVGHFCQNGTMFQMDRTPTEDEEKMVASFVRIQNKLKKPERINYPIPALGDHRIRWMLRFMTPETAEAAV